MFTTHHARLRVHRTPGFPRALCLGRKLLAYPGRIAPRECESVSSPVVVPAKAGTHIPRPIVEGRCSRTSAQHNVLWLWVPAFAGATLVMWRDCSFRHCERSEAIHLATRKVDCFVASLLAMTTNTNPRSRGAIRPSCAKTLSLLNTEGAGKAGCPMHPQPRV